MAKRVIRYKPPITSTTQEPIIRFNLPMTGMNAKECAEFLEIFTEKQVQDAATKYVPKCNFVARVLQAFPSLDFYDLFMVIIESDGTYYTNRLVPLPLSYEEAVGCGLKLERAPGDDGDEPLEPLRINIYDDNVPVCGFGIDGTLYKYGAAFRRSAIAQYIDSKME